MVAVKRINEIKKGEYDEAYAIVRSMKSKSDWLIQEPLLSPTYGLFHEYLNLKNANNWNAQTFAEIYVPRFLKEFKSNPAARSKLNEICIKSQKGKSIALCCFCPSEELCHRSIIAGLLQGVGVNVEIGVDYSKYYELYCTL